MKKLFDENERIKEEGMELQRKIIACVAPVMKEYFDLDYSIRDVMAISSDTIEDCCLRKLISNSINQRKEQNSI